MLYRYNKTNLTYERIQIKTYILSGFIVFCIGMSLGLSPRVITVVEKIPVILQEKEDKFSKEKLKGFIKEMNFKHEDVIYCQAYLESGGFQSEIFKKTNNLFGMKKAVQRINTQLDIDFEYATYDSWKSSLIDRGIWESSYANNLNRSEYLKLLGKIYAEDSLYCQKLGYLLIKYEKGEL